MIPFTVDGDEVIARLTADEAALLRDLAGQLIEMLADRATEATADPAEVLLAQLGIGGGHSAPLDPALARLLPDAYRGDREAASEHRHLTERGLVDRKVANAQLVRTSLESTEHPVQVRLDPAAVQAWLRTLTDLRLTIAARLEIEQEGDEDRLDDEHDLQLLAVYDWLGFLQAMLIEVIDPG